MTNYLPVIGIVVPSLNQGQFLHQALDSIFKQDYPKVNVVVMDGGSTDDSVEIIKTYADRLAYWQSEPDGGQSKAINAGMQRCQGELIAWLNSDDFYYDDCLWKVADAYQAFPTQGLYIGNGFRYNQNADQYTPFTPRHLAFNRSALIFGLDYILQPSVFFSRHAWETVGGLNPDLNFCMDWDILIRLSKAFPVTLINDFLAVSREYEITKTSTGKLKRAYEIANMISVHTGEELSPGSAHYMLETLLELVVGGDLDSLKHTLYGGMQNIHVYFDRHYGNPDGFPELTDNQDNLYLPVAKPDCPSAIKPTLDRSDLPSISLVVPSYNQAAFLQQTLDSIFNQRYPNLEVLVLDGGSSDGSVAILEANHDRLTYWHSKPDAGPADAINQGFALAQGDVVAWLSSDDLLAQGALWAVAKAFLADASLDLVYGNALYIDEVNQLYLADHGTHRTGLYYGRFQPNETVPYYWTYVHAVPQPTVFFCRSLLDQVGFLDESYSFIFDFELFYRLAKVAKRQKIDRIQAFYRIHASSKTSGWNAFLVELYRFSRPLWPAITSRRFWQIFKNFLHYYMKAYYLHYSRRRPAFWMIAASISLSVIFKAGNPEYLQYLIARRHLKSRQGSPQSQSIPQAAYPDMSPDKLLPEVAYPINRDKVRHRSLFCSFFLPLHPGYSGGEIRDFHILRQLLSVSEVDFFALQENPYPDRRDWLRSDLARYITPDTADDDKSGKGMIGIENAAATIDCDRYHHDVKHLLPSIGQRLAPRVQQALETTKPDFIFVSPQVNPILLCLRTQGLDVRCIMASYDVELVRVRRISQGQRQLRQPKTMVQAYLEPRRAAQFERDNLAHFDGIIAVSDLDKSIFMAEYGFEPERVLVVNNSVDTQYFGFTERWPTDQPNITFVGSLTYPPNRQAALRLIQTIMPLVRQQRPEARLWIVGQGPGEELLSFSDGKQVVVTGKVEDVRPYLAQSVAMAAPLSSGSGTKYKILEALSAGVPVVCSSLALEGLNLTPGMHLLQADDDQAVAAALLRLMADPALGADLAQQGRSLIDREYAWDMSLEGIGPWLDAIARLPKRTAR